MAKVITRRRNALKETKADVVFNALNMTIATVILILVIYPLIYVISASFSSGDALARGQVWLWPVQFTLEGYRRMLGANSIVRGYTNSLLYMFVGTIYNVFITILAAYPFSRKDFCGRGIFLAIFMFTMFFGGGLIPSYLLIRDLGMIDTMWAIIIPGAFSMSNVIITMTFLRNTIPSDLLEAAQIDGCGDIKFLFKVVVPLSTTIIAVLALWYAVRHWNSFFSAMIYLNDTKKWPLQLVLRDILVRNIVKDMEMLDIEKDMNRTTLQYLLKYSLIVVSTLPMMILYPFVQKYFVKGVMVGSVKG